MPGRLKHVERAENSVVPSDPELYPTEQNTVYFPPRTHPHCIPEVSRRVQSIAYQDSLSLFLASVQPIVMSPCWIYSANKCCKISSGPKIKLLRCEHLLIPALCFSNSIAASLPPPPSPSTDQRPPISRSNRLSHYKSSKSKLRPHRTLRRSLRRRHADAAAPAEKLFRVSRKRA